MKAEQVISRICEGKAVMFNILRKGDMFTLPSRKPVIDRPVYSKIDSGRAKSTSTGETLDVLPADFVVRYP